MPRRYSLSLTVAVAIWTFGSSSSAEELLPADRPMAEAIDHYVDARLAAEDVTPVPRASDATLVRRLTLDLQGRTPTVAEARAYVESDDAQKRAQLVDRLMDSPLHVRHSATELNTMLRGPDVTGPDLRDYLLPAVKENRSWDRIFRELVGETAGPNKPERFITARLKDVELLTRDTSAIFFGINVTCCQCHTHPYVDTLTRDYYHGMRGFFSRSYEFHGKLLEKTFAPKIAYEIGPGQSKEVGLMFLTGAKVDLPKSDKEDLTKAIQEEDKSIKDLRENYKKSEKAKAEALGRAAKKEEEKKKVLAGEATPDKTEIVAALDKEIEAEKAKAEQVKFVFPEDASYSYRRQLAALALRQENEDLFARSIVNRLWHRLFGHGLVMRIDQMHGGNPGSHPELLAWLARDLKAHGYDLRRLAKGLVHSRAYSRSSEWDPNNPTPPAKELFAVANLRALTPMQFGVSVLLCGDPAFPPAPDALEAKITEVEKAGLEQFEAIIQQPTDDLEIGADEALGMSNNADRLDIIGAKLVPELLKIQERPKQIETAVWSVLSRAPREDELRRLGEYVDAHAGSDGAQLEGTLRQVVWALTTSAEFRFNH